MTHTVVYTQAKYSDEKLKKLIRAVKKTHLEAFYLDEKANTVVALCITSKTVCTINHLQHYLPC